MFLRFLFALLFFIGANCMAIRAQTPDELKAIKTAMVKAVESSKITDSLYTKLTSVKHAEPLMNGYIGTLQALKAKHSWNPYNKIKYVAMATKTMKAAILQAPEDMELRFMRFTIQHYTPRFLGFSKELDEDRKKIAELYKNKHFGHADHELVKAIANFMLTSKRCTPDELLIFKKYV